MMLTGLQTILLVLTGLYFVWTAIMHVSTWYYFARNDRRYPAATGEPAVSIIKPVYGLDHSALENFCSFCEQDYSNDYEIIFCVEERLDPAIPVIKRTMDEFPGRNIQLVFSDPRDTRAIGKLKNMITGFAKSSFDVMVFSDSDAHAPGTFLRDTVACVQRSEIGLAFGAPALEGAENWAAALMNISVNELVLPMATASLFGKFDGAVGTTMVARREVIERIGGLKQFGYQAADDIILGRAIRKEGYQIRILKQPARVFNRRDSFAKWWLHMLRWQVIIRHYWPVKSVITNFLSLGLWWSLFYLVISLGNRESLTTGVLLTGAVLATSLISTAVINLKFVHCKKLWRFLWVVPILEFFRLPLILHSYLTNEIAWRGRRFRLNTDCTLSRVDNTQPNHS